MRWTLGLLLLSAVGCGYRQTKMVACPETGCPPTYASSSPQGLAGAERAVPAVMPMPVRDAAAAGTGADRAGAYARAVKSAMSGA